MEHWSMLPSVVLGLHTFYFSIFPPLSESMEQARNAANNDSGLLVPTAVCSSLAVAQLKVINTSAVEQKSVLLNR